MCVKAGLAETAGGEIYLYQVNTATLNCHSLLWMLSCLPWQQQCISVLPSFISESIAHLVDSNFCPPLSRGTGHRLRSRKDAFWHFLSQFFLIGMDCSGSIRWWSFNINHLSWTPHPSRVLLHICLAYLQFFLNNCSWQISQVLTVSSDLVWQFSCSQNEYKKVSEQIKEGKKKKNNPKERACLCRLTFSKSILKRVK